MAPTVISVAPATKLAVAEKHIVIVIITVSVVATKFVVPEFYTEVMWAMSYYQNGCFKISAQNSNGQIYPLVDGGFTDWTQQLVSSKKERLLVSGVGTELLCSNFLP